MRRHGSESTARPMPAAADTEVYSRVCGFFRPVQSWNLGKKAEFNDRVTYSVESTEAQRE